MLNHLAIATQNILKMREFYLEWISLSFLQDHFYDTGKIRSSWFQFSNTILMLEDKNYSKAPEAILFEWNDSYVDFILQREKEIIQKTDYSIYFLDTDKNKIGFSSYPKKLTF
jgi:hypothetical protein